jgi:hypothetical protein
MSPADYRSYAAKLLTIAAGVNDHQSKAALLAMAQRWQHLAAQGEKTHRSVWSMRPQSRVNSRRLIFGGRRTSPSRAAYAAARRLATAFGSTQRKPGHH